MNPDCTFHTEDKSQNKLLVVVCPAWKGPGEHQRVSVVFNWSDETSMNFHILFTQVNLNSGAATRLKVKLKEPLIPGVIFGNGIKLKPEDESLWEHGSESCEEQ